MKDAPGTLAEAIKDRLGELSPAERKVARVLLAAYPAAGFETVARLAERAAVSAPTVIRFANRLGFRGYPEFQAQLRSELEARDASPITLWTTSGFGEHAPGDTAALIHRAADAFTTGVHKTFSSVPPHDLQTAIESLADQRVRITLDGGRFTTLMSRYLALHLMQMRDGVDILTESPVERSSALARIGRKDLLVILDFRRYEPQNMELARFFHERGAKILLLTDTWLSPISALATVVLPCDVSSPSPYDSLVPLVALVEALVAGVLASLGESAHQRMQRIEESARTTGLY